MHLTYDEEVYDKSPLWGLGLTHSDSPVSLSLNLSEVMGPADRQVPLNAHTDDHVNARNNTDSVKT